MMNDALFIALTNLFQEEPIVCNAGQPATFSCPEMKKVLYRRNTKRYAMVDHWGECYALNCPMCGDTRNRLYVSYLYGQSTRSKNVPYRFGELYKCHNESCDLGIKLKNLKIDHGTIVEAKPSPYIGIVQQTVQLPANCIPLLSDSVPPYVFEYLYSRGFNPVDLQNFYSCHFAPKGTEWRSAREGEEPRVLFEDRILIPVIQGRRLVGWQLRRLVDKPKDKFKYLNSDFPKSKCLYNRDVAMFHNDIVITEGVTDTWRIGSHSIATFGKDINEYQMRLMKLLWGFSGRALLCYDGDVDPGKLAHTVARLRSDNVFPRGVGYITFQPGMDPAAYTYGQINEIISGAWSSCR